MNSRKPSVGLAGSIGRSGRGIGLGRVALTAVAVALASGCGAAGNSARYAPAPAQQSQEGQQRPEAAPAASAAGPQRGPGDALDQPSTAAPSPAHGPSQELEGAKSASESKEDQLARDGEDEEVLLRTLAGARSVWRKAEARLARNDLPRDDASAGDKSKKSDSGSGTKPAKPAARATAPSDCALACRALTSLRRAVDAICRLAGERSNECSEARESRRRSEERVRVCRCG